MSDTRPIYQLLTILHNRLEIEPEYLYMGLCLTTINLKYDGYISFLEWEDINNYIAYHRPKVVWMNTNYYWDPTVLPPRMEWLKKHIKLTTKS